ncbi:MAG: hypothetical protein LBF74_00485, partial [Treponema sp.]|nr:hypothetical protein [Treponema sp.]
MCRSAITRIPHYTFGNEEGEAADCQHGKETRNKKELRITRIFRVDSIPRFLVSLPPRSITMNQHTNPPRIPWHPAFVTALKLELEPYR